MKKIALVTGASSGIGLELSRLLAQDTNDLVIVARHAEALELVAQELEQEYQIKVYPFAQDLSKPEAPRVIFDFLQTHNLEVEILINNAGFATHGAFAESNPEQEMAMLEVNIKALTHLTRLALRQMLRNGQGRILNLASTAAFQPGPFMAGYYASKAFVLSFSEALANEVRGSGLTVTVLCPGPTKTNFAKRAGIEGSILFNSLRVMEAASVAKIGYRAMLAGKPVVIAGHFNTVATTLMRLAPRGLAGRFARMMQE